VFISSDYTNDPLLFKTNSRFIALTYLREDSTNVFVVMNHDLEILTEKFVEKFIVADNTTQIKNKVIVTK
jgi:hypothetical protein